MPEYDYVITLKQPDYKGFNAVNHILLFLSLAFFAYAALTHPDARIFFSATGIATLGCWVYFLSRTNNKTEIVFYRLALVVASIGWFHEYGNIWIGGLL